VGNTVLGCFRTQMFVTRSDIVLVKGIQHDAPSIVGIYTPQGIKKDFRVFMNSIILSPFIIGFVKPRIFLSKNNFSDLETELILRHEMMHLKAKDYFYRRLMFILCVMYWFNPAVHIFLNKFIEINEMACDEATLKNYSNREKLVYAKLLRDMACSKPSIENIICLTGKTAINLQRRIINIMNSKKMMKKILEHKNIPPKC